MRKNNMKIMAKIKKMNTFVKIDLEVKTNMKVHIENHQLLFIY